MSGDGLPGADPPRSLSSTDVLRRDLRLLERVVDNQPDDRLAGRGERLVTAVLKWLDDVDDYAVTRAKREQLEAKRREAAELEDELRGLKCRVDTGDARLPAGVTTAQVRQWAVKAGVLDATKRGRLPGYAIEAWATAHRSTAPCPECGDPDGPCSVTCPDPDCGMPDCCSHEACDTDSRVVV